MNIAVPFRPKLIDTLKNYSSQDFTADLIAGLTVGIVALPLAMAFAIASGVPPQAGIFTAVIAGLIISALGGTKVCIGIRYRPSARLTYVPPFEIPPGSFSLRATMPSLRNTLATYKRLSFW